MQTPSLKDFEKLKISHKDTIVEIYNLIGHDIEASKFVLLYGEYVEMVDDIIDEAKDPKLILKAFNTAMCLFSSPFWIKYHQQLMLIDVLINDEYAVSVEWAESSSEWMRKDSKVLSHRGYNMLFAVIALVAGRDALRKVSSKFRQYCHVKHLTDGN